MHRIGRRAVLVIFLIVGFVWQAHGDVTTCFGSDNCTVSTPDGARQMSKKEAFAYRREQERDRLDRIDCDYASDRARCRQLLDAALALFR
jgi:hypothetical protein